MNDANPLPPKPNRSLRLLAIAALGLSAASVVFSALAFLFATGVIPLPRGAGFESQVRAYLLANPELILESVNNMEVRQKAAEDNELIAVLTQRRDEVFDDPASPVGANPQGDAALVEFFDYNCPYCRTAAPMLAELEQADKGLRIVFKEFPILGAGSTFAARAALASQKQGKYLAFHKAMMTHKGAISEGSALEIAAAVNIDIERLKKDMEDPAIDEAIKRNLELAGALRISGTPTFIVGNEIRRGLVDAETIKLLIATTRQR